MKKPKPARIEIKTRHGHMHVRVRYGVMDLDGAWAVVVIAIIIAARITRVILRMAWALVVWAFPHLRRHTVTGYKWIKVQAPKSIGRS